MYQVILISLQIIVLLQDYDRKPAFSHSSVLRKENMQIAVHVNPPNLATKKMYLVSKLAQYSVQCIQ